MKKLKFKYIKTIDMQEWDKLVIETYGRPYRLQQQDGCKSRGVINLTIPCDWAEDFKNDNIPEETNGEEMGVSFKAWLARDPKEWNGKENHDLRSLYIDLFWSRNFYPSLEVVANDLYKKGLIEAGEYNIIIDW